MLMFVWVNVDADVPVVLAGCDFWQISLEFGKKEESETRKGKRVQVVSVEVTCLLSHSVLFCSLLSSTELCVCMSRQEKAVRLDLNFDSSSGSCSIRLQRIIW